MKITISPKKIKDTIADLEIVFVVNEDLKHRWVADEPLLKKMAFEAKQDELLLLAEKNRLYFGIKSMSHEDLRIACAEVIRNIRTKNFKSIKLGVYFDDSLYAGVKAMTEGLVLGLYDFDKYKSKAKIARIKNIYLCLEDYKLRKLDSLAIKKAKNEGEIIAQNVNFTRDIVNQTPADIDPLVMSKIAREIAKTHNLKVNIFGEKYIKEQKMGAFLAVSLASPFPPQLIHLVYKPKKASKKITLVGKGLTFDTGGLNLKLGESMLTMKMDKAGGCAIFGIMKAVAMMQLPIEVHGIIGAVENAIGQHAFKPDDVLVAKNGKTIEVKNTDAEGRLVLADCLCYAQDLKPDYIIDMATLTGACVVALGQYTIGVMGNSTELKDSLRESGERSGELTGDLPFNRYLPKLNESKVADISNVASQRWGGAITAGLFLSEFIKDEYKEKWAHLDIAGPAYNTSAWGENPVGASGAGVRIVYDWLNRLSKS